MTCAACSTAAGKNLKQATGVKAAINLAAEKAQIDFDPVQASPASLIQAIQKTGFSVPEQRLQLAAGSMTLRSVCHAHRKRAETGSKV